PGKREEVQRLFIARAALRQRNTGGGGEPGMAASPPPFPTALREQVGLCNGAGEDQGVMGRGRGGQSREAKPRRVLGGRHEHSERVGRNAKLRKEVMLDGGV